MLIIALTLACTGRSSTAPEPAAEATPTEEVAAPDLVRDPADAEAAAEEPTEEPAAEATVNATSGEAATGELLGAGSACLDGTECASGICEGEGCDDDSPGVCAATDRPCTRDLRPYCGCDGKTFRTSGVCPNQRYASKGPCEGDPGLNIPMDPK